MNDLRRIRRLLGAWNVNCTRLDKDTINVEYTGDYSRDVMSGNLLILDVRDKLEANNLHTMWMSNGSVNVYFK